MMPFKSALIALATFLSCFFVSTQSHASFSGCADIKITFRNLGGNYCDDTSTSSNCHGYWYLKSKEYNKDRPISGVRVVLKDFLGAVIDDDVSDSNGHVTLCAIYDAEHRIEWYSESDDGRIKVYDDDGSRHRFYTGSGFHFTNGATVSYKFTWGTSSTANPNAHAYYAARMLWNHSLDSSGRLAGVYTGVKIYTESSKCPTSCADRHQIWLNPGSAKAFQSRVLHEMGHTVADLASRNSYIGPNSKHKSTGLGDPWSNTSIEAKGVAMNEAYGTFVGSTALMKAYTDVPLQCSTTGACSNTNDTNMESTPTCNSDNVKRHAQVIKYLWDVWDSGDGVDEPFYRFPDAMHQFSNGRGKHEKSEHYKCILSSCWVDDKNQRALDDFQYNFESKTGTDTSSAVSRNCL